MHYEFSYARGEQGQNRQVWCSWSTDKTSQIPRYARSEKRNWCAAQHDALWYVASELCPCHANVAQTRTDSNSLMLGLSPSSSSYFRHQMWMFSIIAPLPSATSPWTRATDESLLNLSRSLSSRWSISWIRHLPRSSARPLSHFEIWHLMKSISSISSEPTAYNHFCVFFNRHTCH